MKTPTGHYLVIVESSTTDDISTQANELLKLWG